MGKKQDLYKKIVKYAKEQKIGVIVTSGQITQMAKLFKCDEFDVMWALRYER